MYKRELLRKYKLPGLGKFVALSPAHELVCSIKLLYTRNM